MVQNSSHIQRNSRLVYADHLSLLSHKIHSMKSMNIFVILTVPSAKHYICSIFSNVNTLLSKLIKANQFDGKLCSNYIEI